MTDENWKKKLTKEEYHILRKKGTERPFTCKYWNHHEKGVYRCAGCGAPLFSSKDKYDSGTGWPSFDRPMDESNVAEEEDTSFGMRRTEILCKNCGGHLGHKFDDGPKTTSCRYCINSAALKFDSKSTK